MLKKLLILVFVLSLFTVYGYSQDKGTITAYGTLGGNFSWLDSTRADDYENKFGYQLGGGAFYTIMDNIAVGGGLNFYLTQGTKFDKTETQGASAGTAGVEVKEEGVQHLLYLQVPLLAKINTPMGLAFMVGPSFNFLLGAQREYTPSVDGQTNEDVTRKNTDDFKKIDIGLRLGIGYNFELSDGMAAGLGINYNHGFMDIADDMDEKIRNRSITLDINFFYDI